MRVRPIAGALFALMLASPCIADDPAPAPPAEPTPAPAPEAPAPDAAPEATADIAATVLGVTITNAQLDEAVAQAAAQGMQGLDRAVALQGMIVQPLVNKYVEDYNLQATDEELATFVERMAGAEKDSASQIYQKQADAITAMLADDTLPDDRREELTKQLHSCQRRADGEMWPDAAEREELAKAAEAIRTEMAAGTFTEEQTQMAQRQLEYADRFANLDDDQAKAAYAVWETEQRRQMAAPFIEWWKFNRALFKKYGGRILFQQAGLEAFDATRTWLEESKKAGDFAITDPQIENRFWAYFTNEQFALIDNPTGTEFDVPWWEESAPEE